MHDKITAVFWMRKALQSGFGYIVICKNLTHGWMQLLVSRVRVFLRIDGCEGVRLQKLIHLLADGLRIDSILSDIGCLTGFGLDGAMPDLLDERRCNGLAMGGRVAIALPYKCFGAHAYSTLRGAALYIERQIVQGFSSCFGGLAGWRWLISHGGHLGEIAENDAGGGDGGGGGERCGGCVTGGGKVQVLYVIKYNLHN